MIISVFEKPSFYEWCNSKLHKNKRMIIEKAIFMVKSTTNHKKELDIIDILSDTILDSLNEIRLMFRENEQNNSICNSILVYESISLIYNLDGIYTKLLSTNISKVKVSQFFESLSLFITDATVAHWKTINNLPCPIAMVENTRGDKGFFPISYELGDYISLIKKELGKEIVFKSGSTVNTTIKRKSIELYFSKNRLKCDYLILLQLFEVWLHHNGYSVKSRDIFSNQESLPVSQEYLMDAILYLLQNKYATLYFNSNFCIWDDSAVGGIVSFSCTEKSFFGAFNYICRVFKENISSCKCKNLDLFGELSETCPIIQCCDEIISINNVDVLDTPEKMKKIAESVFNKILNY